MVRRGLYPPLRLWPLSKSTARTTKVKKAVERKEKAVKRVRVEKAMKEVKRVTVEKEKKEVKRVRVAKERKKERKKKERKKKEKKKKERMKLMQRAATVMNARTMKTLSSSSIAALVFVTVSGCPTGTFVVRQFVTNSPRSRGSARMPVDCVKCINLEGCAHTHPNGWYNHERLDVDKREGN